jgi:hypothetical protein
MTMTSAEASESTRGNLGRDADWVQYEPDFGSFMLLSLHPSCPVEA